MNAKIKQFWNTVDLCRVNPFENEGYDDEYDVAVELTLEGLKSGKHPVKIVREIVRYYNGSLNCRGLPYDVKTITENFKRFLKNALETELEVERQPKTTDRNSLG